MKNILALLLALSINVGNTSDYTTEHDITCLAKNIYFEAGNQPLVGKVAVANVTLNRVKDFQFPNTVCGVIYQAEWTTNWKGEKVPTRNRCQFSWFCDGKPDQPTDSETWVKSINVAEQVLDKYYPDVTENSLWYHADYIKPNWSNYLNKTVQIEAHIFYK